MRLLVVLALLAAVAVMASKLMARVATSTRSQGGRKGTVGWHDRTFYVNGWQSWSFTGSFVGSDSAMPPYRLGGTLNAGFHSGGHPPPAISTASRKGGVDAAGSSYNASPPGIENNGKGSRSSESDTITGGSNRGGKSPNGGGGWGILGDLFNRGNAAQSATANSPEGYKVAHWFGVLAAPIDVTFASSSSRSAGGAASASYGGGGASGDAGAESSGRDGERSPLAAAAAQLAQYTRQQRQQHVNAAPVSMAALQTYEGVVTGCVFNIRAENSSTDNAQSALLLGLSLN